MGETLSFSGAFVVKKNIRYELRSYLAKRNNEYMCWVCKGEREGGGDEWESSDRKVAGNYEGSPW